MNVFIVSIVFIFIILIIMIFELNRNIRQLKKDTLKIEKIIYRGRHIYPDIKDEYNYYMDKFEEEDFLSYLENKKIEITEFIKNNNLHEERKDNLKIELDIFIMKATKEIKKGSIENDVRYIHYICEEEIRRRKVENNNKEFS